MIQNIKQTTISNLPHKPGVYRFYSTADELLYIGKAKDLKNRVSSYFQEGRPKNQRLTLMISQIERIEYTMVSSEKESIILEANLIHQLQPKYNILLKDDRSYINVRITNSDPIPGIFLTRKKFDPKSDYFGPYTRKFGISQTLRTLRTIFPYCQERFPQKKPCSYVGIKQCDGICVGRETKQDYLAKLVQIKNILKGKTDDVENFIKNKIRVACDDQNFELASLWRDRLRLLETTISDQKIILPQPQNLDIITLIIDNDTGDGLQIASVFVQSIRLGKMINVNNFLLSGTEEIEDSDKTISTQSLQKSKGFFQDDDHSDNSKLQRIKSEVIHASDKIQSLEFNFLQRFMSSFYAQNTENINVLIQLYKVKECL